MIGSPRADRVAERMASQEVAEAEAVVGRRQVEDRNCSVEIRHMDLEVLAASCSHQRRRKDPSSDSALPSDGG